MKNEEPQFISLAAAAKLTNYSQDYISLLCRQGKLKAEKLGRNWVTTKEWVYEYVDKTEGKGAASVPVKVKGSEKKENGGKKSASRPLFGSSVLELAIFCTITVILLANAIGFWKGLRDIDDSFYNVQQYTAYQNYLAARQYVQDKDEKETISSASSGDEEAVPCDQASSSLGLLAFDKETDESVIAEVTAEVQQSLTEPVAVEVYRNFAIVSLVSDPEKRFVYVIR
jgi:hypothetical protein